jgi:ABC-type nickel/cobalt efflux system permease component RcnA
MTLGPELLLVGAVAAVGVLHTIVPDHWVPITLIARQRGWSMAETARAALIAGTGHVASTLLIAAVVWLAGVAVATRFGQLVDTAASIALILFGGWIAISAWRELRGEDGHSHGHSYDHGLGHDYDHHHGHAHDHGHSHHHQSHNHTSNVARNPLYAPLRADVATLTRHAHVHRHHHGPAHTHWHDHLPETAHLIEAVEGEPPLHEHRHKMTARTALLVILGSSPMVEGIPAFFAAGKYGVGLIVVMSIVFALSTIATYVLLCVYSAAGLQRVRLGAFERYGEVLSGAFIALVGIAFWIWPFASP